MKKIVWTEADVETSVSVLCETLVRPGAVALVPTETVYGLIARVSDSAAIERIFQLKRRPAEKKVGWFAGSIEMVRKYGGITDDLTGRLVKEFMPGALTLIVPRADGSSQGFRIPNHRLLLGVLEKLDEPLVQTSANVSGCPDARSCDEALKQLAGSVDCAVDGGVLPPDARGSTVADVTGGKIRILRQGAVDLTNWL